MYKNVLIGFNPWLGLVKAVRLDLGSSLCEPTRLALDLHYVTG